MDIISNLPDKYKQSDYIFSKFELRIISILECTNIDMFLISSDLKIIYANSAYLLNSGLDIENVIGNYCYKVVCNKSDPKKNQPNICPIAVLLQKKKTLIKTEVFKDKNGNQRLVHVVTSIIKSGRTDEICLYAVLPVKDTIKINIEANFALNKFLKLLDTIMQSEHQEHELSKIRLELENTRKILDSKIASYDQMSKDIVNRELIMIELKQQINLLQSQLSQIKN
jgi:hypothetical protein